MTDTTKPVDLSTLEQGDTVIFRDGQKALVNHVIECSSDYFTVFLFMIDRGRPIHIERDYRKDGVCTAFTYNPQIVEIIKNPKQWSNSDMKAAFNEGIRQSINLYQQNGKVGISEWLEQYKQVNHEQ